MFTSITRSLSEESRHSLEPPLPHPTPPPTRPSELFRETPLKNTNIRTTQLGPIADAAQHDKSCRGPEVLSAPAFSTQNLLIQNKVRPVFQRPIGARGGAVRRRLARLRLHHGNLRVLFSLPASRGPEKKNRILQHGKGFILSGFAIRSEMF